MGAGLPGWGNLLDTLTTRVTDPAIRAEINDLKSLLDRAELLQATLKDSLGPELPRIIGQIARYSLSHALLASLRCEQAVTTNYDTLYERALNDARGDHQVFPFDAPRPQIPWLLKMHGDVARPSPITLSRSDFVGYAAAAGPMGAIVQTLLMTKHLLVVGRRRPTTTSCVSLTRSWHSARWQFPPGTHCRRWAPLSPSDRARRALGSGTGDLSS